MPRQLLFASGNHNKHLEIKPLLPVDLELVSPADLGWDEDIPETGKTLEENALQKAKFLWDRFGTAVFADDTGLEVEALQGAPGVYSARYAGEQKNADDNMQKLLSELDNRRNRHAHFRTVIAYIDEQGKEHLFEGQVNGVILREKRGDSGFGYDPVFLPDGQLRSFAEMTLEEKNALSHRARALKAFMEFLQSEKS